MASHLLLADWIREDFRPEPVLVDQGYPIGPHALVAGIGDLLGSSSVEIFAGLTLAIPALTALVAFSALDGLRTAPRVGAAALVALPYMAAAYLAQEAFKEPIVALFLLGFALLLPAVRGWRDAIPLGVLAAGTVYVYSFPGLAWLAGVAAVWGVFELLRGRRPGRPALLAVGIGLLALALLVVPELDRLRDFRDFRALDPDRANEGGLGNLPGQISPLEALGIWPTSEFRLSAAASSIPAVVFYAGAVLAACAFALALPRWLRRHGTAIPAALTTAVLPLHRRPRPRHRLHLRQGPRHSRPPDHPHHPRRPLGGGTRRDGAGWADASRKIWTESLVFGRGRHPLRPHAWQRSSP